MKNSELTRGTLVTYLSNPYVVVRPDSDQMVELFPGDELKTDREMRDGRKWVYSASVQPREIPAPAVDETLEAVIRSFTLWAGHERDKGRQDGPKHVMMETLAFTIAGELVKDDKVERHALANRIMGTELGR
jgi:hypothetical protein